MTSMSRPAATSAVTWRLWIGPLVWAVHFLTIYGFTALACARGLTSGAANVVVGFIGAVTLLAATVLGVTIWLAVRNRRPPPILPATSEFTHWLATAINSLALLAVVWEAMPVLFVPICA